MEYLRMRTCLRVVLLCTLPIAAPAQTATPIDGVAMVRETRFDMSASGESSMGMHYDMFVLFRGGAMFRGIPAGPPSTWDADALVRDVPRSSGRWSELGGALRIVSASGTSKEHSDWFRMTPGRAGETLQGRWRRVGSIAQQAAGRTSSASAIRELALFSDGRFNDSVAGGASTGSGQGGVVSTSRQATAGAYRIHGWEIEFRYDDGRVLRQFYCASSDQHATIVIGGSRMTLQK